MSDTQGGDLLGALLDSWDRNNTILLNLLRALPRDTLDIRPTEGSPTIGGLFAHIRYCRLVFVAEDAPECAAPVPEGEWRSEHDRDRIAMWLHDSAHTVRTAVATRIRAGRNMDCHYDHPLLMLQHMIWHEGYHHGQIKLALKLAGHALADEEIGRTTWDIWMDKS